MKPDNLKNKTLTIPRTQDVRLWLPVKEDRAIRVLDSDGTEVEVETSPIRPEVLAYPGRWENETTTQVSFVVPGVPALGEFKNIRTCLISWYYHIQSVKIVPILIGPCH